jgi:nucleotide-binding universal stress UspA family protein
LKILLAVDHSKFSDAAVRSVVNRANPKDTEVRIVNVPEMPTHLEGETFYGGIDAAFEREAKRSKALIAKISQVLRAKGFKVSVASGGGDPRQTIIDVAAKWKADLIVLGSHGRSGLNRFLMGSVSEAVARHAPCSVEIVRVPASSRKG